ncbi:hypothetical protein LTR37_000354 [Vermiconidia calcicola]|uniref:Uncharacterized protein n=1 Tax=Vermiconidia calcicola TaxID=1690605 RepID=A0ACC3NY14_9PEZI|nr:hypothetical protein LTR37_000354 [Vermiconidia calcicola]
MVTVALVGASTGFGRTMLMNFLHHNDNKHKLVLLSRSEQPELLAQGVDVRPVDYSNHSQLVKALDDVHTVLSLIGGGPPALAAQLELIKACQEAGVKRFAPSEYAGVSNEGIDLYASKKEVWEATKTSGLEYTRFSCGLFMSALATGTPKPVTELGKREGMKSGEEEALAGMRRWNFVVNMKAGTADYPGDGTAPMVLTDMRGISLFVFRALDMEKWPETLGMRGDVKSFREIVEICEKVQGRKWLTKTNPLEELSARVDDPGKKFYNQVRLRLAEGWAMVGDELNKEFPDMKPITCEEFIDKWWSGVKLDEASWEEDVYAT